MAPSTKPSTASPARTQYFGVLPGGTANVLANEIGLADRPDHAAKQLLLPRRYVSRSARSNAPGCRAAISCSWRASASMPRSFITSIGILRKGWASSPTGMAASASLAAPVPRFQATLNGAEPLREFRADHAVRNYGGDFEIARQVRLTDNDFEVVLFRPNRFPNSSASWGRDYKSPGRHRWRSGARAPRGRGGESRGRAVYMQTDGEPMGVLPATISIVPDALTILIPRGYAGI